MEKVLLIAFLVVSSLGFCQTGERIMVNGRISVPAGDDPEGISVFNTSSSRGTVSDENGDFKLAVAVGDIVTFSALQFQEFTIIIDKNIVDVRELNVFVTEATTVLPEVLISRIDLTGSVRVDVQRIPDPAANIPNISKEDVFDASLEFRPGELTSPENAAMRDSFIKNGLNFANIIREIFSSRETGDKHFEPMAEQVREIYDDEFFQEYLNLDQAQITSFILYAEEKGLTEEMLDEGNELELIDFLIMQGRRFKAERRGR